MSTTQIVGRVNLARTRVQMDLQRVPVAKLERIVGLGLQHVVKYNSMSGATACAECPWRFTSAAGANSEHNCT